MAITTTGNLPDLYPGEYWKFTITLTKDGVAPDITGDVLTCTMKTAQSDADSAALLKFNADVTTQGASGIAIFAATSTQTKNLTAGEKYVDVWWYPSNDQDRPVVVERVIVKTRTSDVPA